MRVIAIISATFCEGSSVCRNLTEKLRYKLLSDDLLDITSKIHNISKEKLQIAMFGSSSTFNMLDLDRRLYLTYIKSELLKAMSSDNIICYGYAIHLLPPELTQVLKVCLYDNSKNRIKRLLNMKDYSEKEAQNYLKHDDLSLYNWTQYLFNKDWIDKELYDIIIPMNKNTIESAVELILLNATSEAVKPTDKSLQAVTDNLHACSIQIKLLEKKHNVEVKVNKGKVEVYLKKYILFFEKYKKELVGFVESMDGVKSVEIKISKTFKMPAIAGAIDLDIAPKILLVDDEVEFVQTLSERLKTRNIDSSIAFNGQEALDRFETDPPEVMILDLKMPGINGLEVLERVKKKHPNTEVIILTGHGSKNEEQITYELGAFAYLEKPVDINILSETMRKAYEKVNRTKG